MLSTPRTAITRTILACSVATASLICIPAASAQADPGQQAAAQATQQANMIAIQAAQQANQQAMQAAQQANQQAVQASQQAMQAAQQAAANTSAGPPRPGYGRADKPTFSPPPGKFSGSVQVSISDPTTPKAEIFYTLDGSAPTPASMRYSGPIVVTASTKLRAMAQSPIYSPSRVANGKYVIR
jgi:hypothetical protein